MANIENQNVHSWTQFDYQSQQLKKGKNEKKTTIVIVLNESILMLFTIHVVLFVIIFTHFLRVPSLCCI